MWYELAQIREVEGSDVKGCGLKKFVPSKYLGCHAEHQQTRTD